MNIFQIQQNLFELENFLAQYSDLWGDDIIVKYPTKYSSKIEMWAQYLNQLSTSEVIAFENNLKLPVTAPIDFQTFIESIIFFIKKIPALAKENKLLIARESHWLYWKNHLHPVKDKKLYELFSLEKIIHQYHKKHPIFQFIDFAGGVGHLSHFLSHTFQAQSLTIDINPVWQNLFFERKKTNNTDANIIISDISKISSLSSIIPISNDTCAYCFLHACGDIADFSIDLFLRDEVRYLFGLGCCYHLKKTPIHFLHFPLSLSIQSLHLAAYSLGTMDEERFYKRLKVKKYRYTLEFFLRNKFQTSKFHTLKSSPAQLYQKSFLTYAQVQFQKLQITLSRTEEVSLMHLLESSTLQEEISRIVSLELLRNCFGRLIEIYIALRRVEKILAKSSNYQIELGTIFDEQISPRNILLFAQKD